MSNSSLVWWQTIWCSCKS